MYTSSPPSGSSFSLGRPRAKSLVASSESSMSTPTTESKNLAEELPPVASKDSDSSCDPHKHRMSLRPASSSGSSFDWFADGDDNWTDAKYDDLLTSYLLRECLHQRTVQSRSTIHFRCGMRLRAYGKT